MASTQTLSVAALHAEATRAFLQRNYASAIAQTADALQSALASSPSSSSTSTSTSGSGSHEVVFKSLILRITALCTLYNAHSAAGSASSSRRTDDTGSASSAVHPASSSTTMPMLTPAEVVLAMDKTAFLAHLWADTLAICNCAARGGPLAGLKPPPPSLQPADEPTLLLALAVPASVLVTLIYASLALDDNAADTSQLANGVSSKSDANGDAKMSASTPTLPSTNGTTKTKATSGTEGSKAGLRAARAMAEWYLAAYSNGAAQSKHADDPSAATQAPTSLSTQRQRDEAYRRVMQLYCVQLVGLRAGEWEYASETIGYSVLDEPTKRALLSELEAVHAHAQSTSIQARGKEIGKLLERERKASESKTRAAAKAASLRGGADLQQPAVEASPSGPTTSRRVAVGARTSSRLAESTPSLTRANPSSSKTASSALLDTSRDAIGRSNDEGRLTTDLIRAANDNVRRRRERDGLDSPTASGGLESGATTTRTATRNGNDSSRQGVVSSVLSTYLVRPLFSRYISILLFVLVLAYPRLRARRNAGIPQAPSTAVTGISMAGSFVRRLWDTIRMGTQVTYL